MINIDNVRKQYDVRRSTYVDLLREAEFIIKNAIDFSNIKIHNISTRIKKFESLIKKCEDKEFVDPFDVIHDIAGLRIVCLFRSDLSEIEKLITTAFNLIVKDDKVSHADGFGYMSVHYICTMRDDYSGPRYDYLRRVKFEIQTRTLCMDAWAAVSHYLSYKGDWDVPTDLKRAMNALSGLFYVADNEFLQVYNESIKSKSAAAALIESASKTNIPVNFDTVQAYISDKFPDRRKITDDRISKLVHELSESGYRTIEYIDEDVNNSIEIFNEYEIELKRLNRLKNKFASLGAFRVCLALTNKRMEQFRSSDGVSRDYDSVTAPFRQRYLRTNKDRSGL